MPGQRPERYAETMDARSTGVVVVVIGVAVILVGLLVMTGALNWFGRLPGDIRYESGNTRIYIPITTMLLVSVGLSVVLYIARRIF
ncbi:MAG TPA: DUF2905 domain-containing protein [Tepidiformaceae bacterium]